MLKTKVVVGSVVVAFALGLVAPASAYRGSPRFTEIKLSLASTRVTEGDPVKGRVNLTWATSESSGEFDRDCYTYALGACFPGSGTLSYKIGEDEGSSIDWMKDGKLKELGSFKIPFNPGDLGADHPYVLKLTFRDAFGGPVFYGSTAKKTFHVYR